MEMDKERKIRTEKKYFTFLSELTGVLFYLTVNSV